MSGILSSPSDETILVPEPATLNVLAKKCVALVRKWLTEAEQFPVDASGEQLAGVLKDPSGLEFTVGFVDGVIRPEDIKVAARKLTLRQAATVTAVERVADAHRTRGLYP